MSAETVLIDNVRGYTWRNNGLHEFNALCFRGDTILETAAEARQLSVKYGIDHKIDGKGKTMLPGLIDAHGHILELGYSRLNIDLSGAESIGEIKQRIETHLRKHPDSEWIEGYGWDESEWDENRLPRAKLLDEVVDDRPAWLVRKDRHAGWANSEALRISGITKSTTAPKGGEIVRTAGDEPTGILIDEAMNLVEQHLPSNNEQRDRQALREALSQFRSCGLTAVHDACMDRRRYRLFLRAARRGTLTTRIYGMVDGRTSFYREWLEHGPARNTYEEMLTVRSVKFFADGAIGSRGAALLEPYSDDPDNRGILFYNAEKLAGYIQEAANAGFQVNIHAIGDRANRTVLDAHERAGGAGETDLRHRVEHCQILHPSDIPRLRQLRLIASVQPAHAVGDMGMVEKRIGRERMRGAYAWRQLLKEDVRLAAGSDFPVETPDPFYGMHTAVNRQDQRGLPEGGWYPEQRISRQEAFRAYTIGAAQAAHQEDVCGSLESGKKADFILIDRDPFKIEPHNLMNIKVLQTWIAGRRVYAIDSPADSLL